MAAPVPKDPSERRNRTKPQRGEWIDIDQRSIDTPVLPLKPPDRRPFVPFRWYARNTWASWRNDPVTTYWTESDINFALETLGIIDDEDGVTLKNAAEVRHRCDRLALTPKGKRDLRFRITFGAGKEATKDKPLPENVVTLDDRRKQLEHGA